MPEIAKKVPILKENIMFCTNILPWKNFTEDGFLECPKTRLFQMFQGHYAVFSAEFTGVSSLCTIHRYGTTRFKQKAHPNNSLSPESMHQKREAQIISSAEKVVGEFMLWLLRNGLRRPFGEDTYNYYSCTLYIVIVLLPNWVTRNYLPLPQKKIIFHHNASSYFSAVVVSPYFPDLAHLVQYLFPNMKKMIAGEEVLFKRKCDCESLFGEIRAILILGINQQTEATLNEVYILKRIHLKRKIWIDYCK